MSFESMRVEDIRKILIDGGIPEEIVKMVKGKANLVFELQKLIQEGKITLGDDAVPVEAAPIEVSNSDDTIIEADDYLRQAFDEVEPSLTPGTPVVPRDAYAKRAPNVTDEGWQEYVMGQLSEKDYFNGNPKVAALRLLAEKVLGEIVFSGPVQVFPCTDANNNGRCSVLYKLEIAWRAGLPEYIDINRDLPTRQFMAAAEAFEGNIPLSKGNIDYRTFPLTIAETRAEGRALRKALYLKNVVTAEECNAEVPQSEAEGVVGDWNGNDKASEQQVNSIQLLCKRTNVDFTKLVPDVEKLTRQDAATALKTLNDLQQSGEPVPENLKASE